MRPAKDVTWLKTAFNQAEQSTCHRLSVGCVLINGQGEVLSTGYNGRASGLPHCAHTPGASPCPKSDAPIGQPNGCESIHAEQNALMQCRDVRSIATCYVTHSPCLTCVKLLLNTSCRRIVFVEVYPHAGAQELWVRAGREWIPFAEPFAAYELSGR